MQIYTLLLLIIALIVLAFVYLKEVLSIISKNCGLLREFVSHNGGIFSVFFMFLFFVEQILLILVVYFLVDVSPKAQFIVSIFALVVLTTATLEKFILEKKYEYQKAQIDTISRRNQDELNEMKQTLQEIEQHIRSKE